jgi:hypothetical protein
MTELKYALLTINAYIQSVEKSKKLKPGVDNDSVNDHISKGCNEFLRALDEIYDI